jgi:hypothetical protein
MKLNRLMVAMMASASLFVMTGCSGGGADTSEAEPGATSAETSAVAPSEPAAADSKAQAGGQVVEVGAYHMELVPAVEADGTHLDLFLQKGDDHEAISDAKIMAQVDAPDGTKQSLEMKYDAEGKHYTALLPGSVAGEYKLAVLADIGGEKANGRFNFTK